MKKKKKSGGGCGCLGAPLRALSRACDSACDLYVRGMSGCARGLPSGSSAAGIVGRGGFGGSGSPLRFRVSSDKADDLVRAASSASSRRQRRVATEPQPEAAEAVGYSSGDGKMGSAGGGGLVGLAGPGVRHPARKRAVAAATMGTIAEDAPCDFGPDYGACAAGLLLRPPR